ncbi:MAG: hypothetical protein MMC23_007048 [Stictis urceolatum]|nr:hypothetical protein [Stictis urceolata]
MEQLFRLMDLPLEIRQQIWRSVVCSKNNQEWPDPLGFSKLFGSYYFHAPYYRDMSLLRVSRQIHNEAAAELYQRTVFNFIESCYPEFECYQEVMDYDAPTRFPHQMMNLVPFLKAIGEGNRSRLRRLTFRFDTRMCLHVDETAPGLRHVFWDAFELLSPLRRHLSITMDLEGVMDMDFVIFRGLAEILQSKKENPAYFYAQKFEMLKGIRSFRIIPPDEHHYDMGMDLDDLYSPETDAIVAAYLEKWLTERKRRKSSSSDVSDVQQAAQKRVGALQKCVGALQDRLDARDALLKKKHDISSQLRDVDTQLRDVDKELTVLLG